MTNPYRTMCAELVAEIEKWQQADDEFSDAGTIRADANYDLAPRARALLDQSVAEGPIATEHARTQEINDLIAETVYGPRGSETSACANAWEVSKLIASLQTRVKALEALDD